MTRNYRLLFGPLAGIILGFGVAGLALLISDYSHVRQTVSEIGEIGSPARVPFAIMLGCVAACILVFASAVCDVSVAADHSRFTAYLIGFMALPAAGIGVFAYPHPAHNIFGMSELIGYQAPLVFALTWRRDPRAKTLVMISWIFFALIWGAIALNLSAFAASVWAYVKPVHGLAQRALFAAWFGWCAVLGILLFRRNGGIPPMVAVILKSFDAPDEVRVMQNGKFELVHLGGITIGRATYEPGWKWSEHVGPGVGATRCPVEHVGLVLSGTATVAFDDGRVIKLHAGDLFYVPPVPHDSWVIGNEPYVSLHFLGAEKYATESQG